MVDGEPLNYGEVRRLIQGARVDISWILSRITPAHIHACWDDLPENLRALHAFMMGKNTIPWERRANNLMIRYFNNMEIPACQVTRYKQDDPTFP